jgi:transposase InsO family protein
MGIKQVLSTPRWPWQRAYVERAIGTIRRECLDHVIVFSEAGLSGHLRRFADYYHRSRTHLGLQKDTPESRPVQAPEAGGSWRSRRWAGSIIVTNGAPPERAPG